MSQEILVSKQSTLEVNKLIKNTYMLLSMTLAFSALCAWIAASVGISPLMSLGFSIGGFILLFVTLRKADTAAGLFWVFAFTGMEGASLGFILNHYAGMANGPELIVQAFGLTSAIFVGLSMYALTTKKDFSFMGGFLFAGLIVIVIGGLINLFVGNSTAYMLLSWATALVFTGLILFDTSRIVNGGETNYIRATVSLYLDFLNLFLAILRILGMNNDD
ncbi:Bax inhibitor-1/YccA family protein [Shewanella sp.]|uniref:Bax inhibitor-1/YccA family protein n=1 Tax=Shewanella sp. TaxID=50422 RepID=UPI00356286CB